MESLMAGALTNRMRVNFLGGRASADIPLGTTLSSADFNLIPAVAAPNYMTLVFDPDQDFGTPEVIYVTAHAAGDTQMTVVRGREGTAERGHPASSVWRNTATADEYDDIEMRGLPVGSGALWFTATPPLNWLIADGSAIPAQYLALIALIGPTLPDMRGRMPTMVGVGGAAPALGAKGGSWSHTHNGNPHTHDSPTVPAQNTGETGSSHTHAVPDIGNSGGHTHVVPTTGSGGSHDHASTSVAAQGGSGGKTYGDGGTLTNHSHTVTTSSSAHTHSIPDATTNGSGHTHTVSAANTTGAGHTHNIPAQDLGQTSDGSTHGSNGATSASNPPYFGLNFIIKAA
jgi:Phage Tail Collar Domain